MSCVIGWVEENEEDVFDCVIDSLAVGNIVFRTDKRGEAKPHQYSCSADGMPRADYTCEGSRTLQSVLDLRYVGNY